MWQRGQRRNLCLFAKDRLFNREFSRRNTSELIEFASLAFEEGSSVRLWVTGFSIAEIILFARFGANRLEIQRYLIIKA